MDLLAVQALALKHARRDTAGLKGLDVATKGLIKSFDAVILFEDRMKRQQAKMGFDIQDFENKMEEDLKRDNKDAAKQTNWMLKQYAQ